MKNVPLVAIGKTQAEPKADPKVKTKAKAKAEEKDNRKDQSNMITQLKAGANKGDEAKQKALNIYQALPRFSDEKKKMLEKWKLDKTCSWAVSMTNTFEESHQSSQNSQSGFVTKFLGSKKTMLK